MENMLPSRAFAVWVAVPMRVPVTLMYAGKSPMSTHSLVSSPETALMRNVAVPAKFVV